MHELVGPQLLLDYTDVFGATYTERLAAVNAEGGAAGEGSSATAADGGKKVAVGPKGCLHEDGGKFAVFEEVLVTDQQVCIANTCPNRVDVHVFMHSCIHVFVHASFSEPYSITRLLNAVVGD